MTTPKLMPLTEWAAMRYTTPPSLYVLRKLCRAGAFDPPAEKTGRDWYVREDARLIMATPSANGTQADDAPPARCCLRCLSAGRPTAWRTFDC